MMFTLEPVADLVDTLRAAEIRADLDPAKVNLPGVWVQPTDYVVDTLAGTRVDVRLILLVRDKDHRRASAELMQLLNAVAAVVPVRSASPRTVLMPDGSALPGLEVPFAVRAVTT